MSILTLVDENDSLTLTMDAVATTTEPTYAVGGKGQLGPESVGLATGNVAKTIMTGLDGGAVPVDQVVVHNQDTVSHTATIHFKRSGTSRKLLKVTVPVDGSLVWNVEGLSVINSAGARVQSYTASATNAGAAANGAVASEDGFANYHQTLITITDLTQAVVNGTEFESTKVYDFPAGRIHVVGVTANMQFGVTTDRATTINDNAAMDWSVGTAAASNVTLAGTMVDLIPKQDKTLDGLVAAYTSLQGAALAAGAQFDGTATAIDVYLNTSFPTTTDVDANGTLKMNGTIMITWVNLGDY